MRKDRGERSDPIYDKHDHYFRELSQNNWNKSKD